MKNRNLILSLGTFCVMVFVACKKTENGPVMTPQQRALTGKIWKLTSLTVPSKINPSLDSSITTSCGDSAVMAFDIFGVYQLADPSKSCDSTIVPYSKGNWAITSDNDSLLLYSKRQFAWKIEVLNDTILKASFRDSTSGSNNWLKKITLK